MEVTGLVHKFTVIFEGFLPPDVSLNWSPRMFHFWKKSLHGDNESIYRCEIKVMLGLFSHRCVSAPTLIQVFLSCLHHMTDYAILSALQMYK